MTSKTIQSMPTMNNQGPEPEKVEIFLSCRKLKNLDTFSLTDPQITVYVFKKGNWEVFGKTELISDNLNPNFTQTFIFDYHFEQKQRVKFEVYNTGPNKRDLVGVVESEIGEIMGAKSQMVIRELLLKNEARGKIIIRAEKVNVNNSSIYVQFQGRDLHDVAGFFSSNNPVLKISRVAGDNDYVVVYESEVVKKSKNCDWKGFEIKVQKLCNGDEYRPIKIEVCSRSGYKDTPIGEFKTSLNDIMNLEKREFVLVNPKKNKDYGKVRISSFKFNEVPTFIDYLQGGLQLSVIVAIDFTGSNGIPTSPDSLHALKYDGSYNEYQKAIHGVCDILLQYDHDKKVPMFGFGGKPKFENYQANKVEHCFSMTGNPRDPWAYGLDGIMAAYTHSLNSVELSGPTLFAPILSEAMKVAANQKREGSTEYTILLIITDGEIHDMDASIDCLIKSADLPLSVIIVGVGKADFHNMEVLDGDEGLYNNRGEKAQRDLVQFVPFREVQGGSQEVLAQQVLEEIPDQVVEYMTRARIKPQQKERIDVSKILRGNTLEEVKFDVREQQQQKFAPEEEVISDESFHKSQSMKYMNDGGQQIKKMNSIGQNNPNNKNFNPFNPYS